MIRNSWMAKVLFLMFWLQYIPSIFVSNVVKQKSVLQYDSGNNFELNIFIFILWHLNYTGWAIAMPLFNIWTTFFWKRYVMKAWYNVETCLVKRYSPARNFQRLVSKDLLAWSSKGWLGSEIFVFIGPESDHWLCLSLTHSLTAV